MFGRYQLLRLLGKSARTMAWLVVQTEGGSGQSGAEFFIVLPRVQPVGTAAMERWAQAVHRAARLNHPALAPAVEIGVQDGWPYAAYDARGLATLADRLSGKGLAAVDAATQIMQAAEGLAFAHEGGVGHHDLQPYLLLLDDEGRVRLAGLEVASEAPVRPGWCRARRAARPARCRPARRAGAGHPAAPGAGRHAGARRTRHRPGHRPPAAAGPRDRAPALDACRNRCPSRCAPSSTAPPTARSASATATRARWPRALEGWLQIEAGGASGPLALLLDKLRTAGVLPSQPGAAQQAARLALMETQHTNELADVVLHDLALAFELLRAVNTAQVRGGQVSGNGPVLTVRRAIAMLGLEGVRRAALALRPWPGPLNEQGAAALEQLIDARQACRPRRRWRCGPPATTARWSTSSRCCRTWAAWSCSTTSPTRPRRSAA